MFELILCIALLIVIAYLVRVISLLTAPRQAEVGNGRNLPLAPRRSESKEIVFGGTPSESVEEFIRQLDVEAAVQNLSDRETVQLAVSGFTKNAARWYEFMAYRIEELTWPELRQWLREHYVRVGSPLTGAEGLLRLRYRTGDDFEAFAWRFRDMYLEWRFQATEEEIAQALVDRISHAHKWPLGFMHFRSVREVIMQLRRLSLYNNLPDPENRRTDRRYFARDERERPAVRPIRVRCFRCGEMGHIARECQQENQNPGTM